MADEAEDVKASQGYLDFAEMRFGEAMNKPVDAKQLSLALGLINLSKAQRLATEAIFARIQRLHHKIDRIEKKIGSG